MGRYYSGDIDGKFWFAVQSSNDADFFGVEGEAPEMLEYGFEKDNLSDVKKGLDKCLEELGKNKKILDDFFKEKESYNDAMLVKPLGVDNEDEVKTILKWYARYELGKQIYDCIEENGQCHFEAELWLMLTMKGGSMFFLFDLLGKLLYGEDYDKYKNKKPKIIRRRK